LSYAIYFPLSNCPVVCPIPLLSGVRLQLSVVAADRRCVRLMQAVLVKAFTERL
jgi:hypothetical protein